MKTIFELSLIILLLFGSTEAQFKSCARGWNCVLLNECPSFLKMSRSNAETRKLICGFQNKLTKVCCEALKISIREPADKPDSLTSKESLLPPPKKCGIPKTENLGRIWGGSPAPLGAYPWMVAIGYQDVRNEGKEKPKFQCGGSLINNRYVLTASHCLDKRNLGTRKVSVVHLGDWDVSKEKDCQKSPKNTICAPPHIVAGIEEIIVHPQYDVEEYSSDIGLIRLNMTIDFETTKAFVSPICLPPKEVKLEGVTRGKMVMTAAGWGLTEKKKSSNILLYVHMSLKDSDKCKEYYQHFKEDSQLCIGGMGRDDTCAGDSGGPIFMRVGEPSAIFIQLGVVAYGIDPCAIGNIPSVYTSVTKYRAWIVENLKP